MTRNMLRCDIIAFTQAYDLITTIELHGTWDAASNIIRIVIINYDTRTKYQLSLKQLAAQLLK